MGIEPSPEMVSFDRKKLKRFKKAYNECKGDVFTFEGGDYLKEYAKYVIQYLEMKFGMTEA